MSRISKAAKKDLWKELPPHEQFLALCAGDAYVKNIWATRFAGSIYEARVWWEIQGRPRMKVFSKVKENSIQHDHQMIMAEIMGVLLGGKNSTKKLRDLADAIDRLESPLKPAVDRYRAWLWTQCSSANPADFETDINSGKRPIKSRKTFSEIRAAFNQAFENSVEDSTLRTIIKKDLQVILTPDKKGPKGPRIR